MTAAVDEARRSLAASLLECVVTALVAADVSIEEAERLVLTLLDRDSTTDRWLAVIAVGARIVPVHTLRIAWDDEELLEAVANLARTDEAIAAFWSSVRRAAPKLYVAFGLERAAAQRIGADIVPAGMGAAP